MFTQGLGCQTLGYQKLSYQTLGYQVAGPHGLVDPTLAGSAPERRTQAPAVAYGEEVYAPKPPLAEEPGGPQVEVAAEPYSIRVPHPAGELPCPLCGELFLAYGPTGHAADRPICDLCLLDGSHALGMLLAMAAVARTFSAIESATGKQYQDALEEIAAFARIYDRFAEKSGPTRPFRLPDTVLEAVLRAS